MLNEFETIIRRSDMIVTSLSYIIIRKLLSATGFVSVSYISRSCHATHAPGRARQAKTGTGSA